MNLDCDGKVLCFDTSCQTQKKERPLLEHGILCVTLGEPTLLKVSSLGAQWQSLVWCPKPCAVFPIGLLKYGSCRINLATSEREFATSFIKVPFFEDPLLWDK